MNYASQEIMEEAGWIFDGLNAGLAFGDTFEGWASGRPIGTLSYRLRGVGTATVKYFLFYPDFFIICSFIRVPKIHSIFIQ